MLTIKPLLTAVVTLAFFLLMVGCATVASRDGGRNARREEVTGKIVLATPCRTLVEIETTELNETGEATRMQLFCLDPEVRESAKGVEKGDKVKIQYVFSPETQRNSIRKITKVME